MSRAEGCTDGGCVVRKPKGMHTNGGCNCMKDVRRALKDDGAFARHIERALIFYRDNGPLSSPVESDYRPTIKDDPHG